MFLTDDEQETCSARLALQFIDGQAQDENGDEEEEDIEDEATESDNAFIDDSEA